MWQPEPGWHPLPGGTGPSTRGRLADGARRPGRWSSSGSARPGPHDPAELRDPRHFAYWRRAADVARRGVVDATPGPARARSTAVDEDADGHHADPAVGRGRRQQRSVRRARPGPVRRRRTSGAAPWLARDQLRDRLRAGRAPRRLADAGPDHRRRRRRPPLAAPRGAGWRALDALPQVAQHGDPVPANLPGREGDDVVAVDWATLGHGPVGGDLGYYLLSRPRGVRAAARRLPDGAARRARRPRRRPRSVPGSRRSTPCSTAPSGRWPGSPGARVPWPGSTATPRSRRTCAPCSASSRRSRRW